MECGKPLDNKQGRALQPVPIDSMFILLMEYLSSAREVNTAQPTVIALKQRQTPVFEVLGFLL